MFGAFFKVLKNGDVFECGREGDPRKAKLCIEFVAGSSHGSKGVRFVGGGRSVIPEGMQLHDEMGRPIVPGDGHVLPKAHNACSICVDGEHFPLFSVFLVDGGGESSSMDLPGGVIQFQDEDVKNGVLKNSPSHTLEGG